MRTEPDAPNPIAPSDPTRFGLSSGCFPRLSGPELDAMVRHVGGTVVDLRAGKDQGWETDGGLASITVSVAFIGLSVVLGRPEQDLDVARPFTGLPVKVFAAEDPISSGLIAGQLVALGQDREPGQVLIETHRGYARPDELLELCRTFGCRLVLDNLGLASITDRFDEDVHRMAPFVASVQVKGFDAVVPGRPVHRPLRTDDLGWLARLPGGLDLLVESRAGTAGPDLAVLDNAWRTRPPYRRPTAGS